MALTVNKQQTRRFIDLWPYIALGTTFLIIFAFVISSVFYQNILSTDVSVSEGEPVALEQVQLKPTLVGALRIDAKALLPDNRWVTYEIQLLDEQNQAIASALKQAWAEAGTWYEDGESGTWQESDLKSGLDVRPGGNQIEKLTIAVNVLEYSDTSGREIDEPVSFQVKVQNGVVDTRYLWAGLIGSASLTLLGFLSIPTTGYKAIAKTIWDSDIGDRSIVGGSDRLVKVNLNILADETCPRTLYVNLWVKDGNGEQIYHHKWPVWMKFRKNDSGRIEKATAKVNAFFLFPKRGSYGFYAEVTPDASVDKTTLTVRDGAKTLETQEIIEISY